ncbi:TPA: ABC transporter permease [Clostridioides difficile]|uniref:ABC transporter permease n=1 Tax=Clostridioides difficile TaxID=1496 RepID=UPI00374EF6BC
MRIFYLEIKRVLHSRRTLILLLLALVLSALMAFLPITYEGINYLDDNGKVVELSGLDAIKYKKTIYANNSEISSGVVTPKKLKHALNIWKKTEEKYGKVGSEDFPLDVYSKSILPIRPLLNRLPEAFANSETGFATELSEINTNDLDSFYEQCKTHLNDIMKIERQTSSAQMKAQELYRKVDTPFEIYPGYSKDAFDYIIFYIFILLIICVAIAAPTFSGEYQTQSDSILRCTKHGHIRLAFTKISALFSIFIIMFVICISIHLAISDLAFGTECLKTSFQMLFSVISLVNINLLQAQILIAIGGLISILAMVSLTLFLSAKCKDSLTSMLIAFSICLIPMGIGVSWIGYILPPGGIGFKISLLYQMTSFNFLHLGGMSFWTPHIILFFSVIEIPIFIFLAIRTYCKHQVS